jgi:hypothetical protein
MMKKELMYKMVMFLLLVSLAACKKQLDIKPTSSLQVPVSEADFQALMDNTGVFSQIWPYAGTDGADDGFVSDATWAAVSVTGRNAYIWDRNVFNDLPRNDWSMPYTAVFYANVVLEGTAKYGGTTGEWQHIRGQAAFFRAYAYYQLAQEFCRPYDAQTAGSDPGLVLRASSDLNDPSLRATVSATYNQIIGDLTLAANLLPVNVLTKTRPDKAAAFGMLARTYLSMRDYPKAGLYADSALQLQGQLLDYNQATAGSGPSFKRFNDEVVFHTIMSPAPVLLAPRYYVDTVLYSSYANDDLRKKLFFKVAAGTAYHNFNGSYDGTANLFNGIATDELYLVRAEAAARSANTNRALADLNLLRKSRYQVAAYRPLVSADAAEVLGWVLAERRKELLLRGLRWTDLRRLNTEPAYAKTVVKLINGTRYELKPGDARFVWPVPLEVISNTGIAQN